MGRIRPHFLHHLVKVGDHVTPYFQRGIHPTPAHSVNFYVSRKTVPMAKKSLVVLVLDTAGIEATTGGGTAANG